MNQFEILAFVVMPIFLAAFGWVVALAVDWLDRHPHDI